MHDSPSAPEIPPEVSRPCSRPRATRKATRKTLIQRVQQDGDRASWEDFHQTYKGFIISISLKTGLNAHDAEDLTSCVFNELHRKFTKDPNLDFAEQSFGGWLGNLVKWRIKDFYRKKQKSAEAMEDEVLNHLNHERPFDKVWDKEWRNKLIEMALTRVQESPRNLIIFVDLSIKETPVSTVCDRYHISRSNADTIKSRVLKKLEPIVKELDKGEL